MFKKVPLRLRPKVFGAKASDFSPWASLRSEQSSKMLSLKDTVSAWRNLKKVV